MISERKGWKKIDGFYAKTIPITDCHFLIEWESEIKFNIVYLILLNLNEILEQIQILEESNPKMPILLKSVY